MGVTRKDLGSTAVEATARAPKTGERARRPEPEPPAPSRDWMIVALGVLSAVVLVLAARGVVDNIAMVVYLFAIAAAAVWVARAVQISATGDDGWRTSRTALLLALFVAVPAVFDPETFEIFSLVRYALVVVAAFALAGLWAIGAVRHRRVPWWRNGLRWPVIFLVAWTAVTTATSVNPRFSALGAYEAYDGLYITLAFAAVLFVIADTFRISDLKSALAVLYMGGGGLVVLYGLVQLHDVAVGGRNWDWVPWRGGQGVTVISANLGNANHVGGLLAIMFPIGLVLLVLARSRRVRALIGVTGAAIVVELVHTASRGAWLAVLVASVAVVVLLAGEVRRHPGLFAAVALAYVAVAVVSVLAFGSTGSLQDKLNPDDLSATEATSTNQRVELWRAAVGMANDRPLVGVGPDAFGPRFYAYQSAAWTERYGTLAFANGAHNIFFNQLANQGYPGLAALVALMGSAATLGAVTWRSLRRRECHGAGRRMRPEADADLRRRAREGRLALTAIGGGLVAYVVQATFNIQRVALAFVFWALLGLLCVAARAVGATLPGLRRLSRTDTEPAPAGTDAWSLDSPPPTRRGLRRRPEAMSTVDQFFVYGVAFLVILGLVGVGGMAAAPWRADRAFHQSQKLVDQAYAQDQESGSDTLERALVALEAAQGLNPWEPRYYQRPAVTVVNQAASQPAGSQRQAQLLDLADELYRQVIRVEPGAPQFLLAYGDALLRLYEAQPDVERAREQALAALRRAQRIFPGDSAIAERLATAGASPPK